MLRRSLATATAVLALALPLSSCGFNYATQRDYTPGAGTNDRSGDVDILSAVVVSGTEGSGTLIASLSNGLTDEASTLTAVTGKRVATTEDAEESPVETAEFEPVEVPAGGIVNFAEPARDITLSGDFSAGNFLELTFEFESGQRTTMSVPVVSDEDSDWAGLDAS